MKGTFFLLTIIFTYNMIKIEKIILNGTYDNSQNKFDIINFTISNNE